jgi:PTS system nitrogen regulatory IIA component
MIDLKTVLSPGRTVCGSPGVSKKRLFETIAGIINTDQPQIAVKTVVAALLAREKLGSTALGSGVAIPHCRMPDCDRALGALITLAAPLDFDAPDGDPVDILFVLLVPEEAHQQHLELLASLAKRLNEDSYRSALRRAGNDAELYATALEARS